MAESSQENLLVNKFLISLVDGKIIGYVTGITVEVQHDKFYFILKVKALENIGKTGEFHPGMFSTEKKIKISPEDIVSVGSDAIIIGGGKVPPVKEIERLVQVASEYSMLAKELEEKEKLLQELKAENLSLSKQVSELERELKRYQVLKEDFEHLKEQLIKQEGQLEMAREYIKLLEGLRHDIDAIKANVEKLTTGYVEEVVRNIVNEELNARGLKKTLL
ncbi:hypothetical protein PAP_10265 [Palaeococcus pacificus DY20341]|uniref:Uncharacterized protein n=1 Tax=Palaeococcus pacificus DY20341 TaxID=1343739 RepID=A0A075LVQ9_9EURY|nr:hypothetical protein [Palaeococcus pacificus]AIF70424.1 hypothetical protein PAP_10265 [Palaeococcus pacificus DY20341]